jgi:hypothetical protein
VVAGATGGKGKPAPSPRLGRRYRSSDPSSISVMP